MAPHFQEQVYVGSWVDAELVNNLLVNEGIGTHVTRARVTARFVYHPNEHSVYVLDRDRIDEAREIVTRFRQGKPLKEPRTYRSWRCASCNELVEGQFEGCWNCGHIKS